MTIDTSHARIGVPPPLIFLGYTIGALLLNWALPLGAPSMTAFRTPGWLCLIAGFLLAAWAVSTMMQAHTSPDPDRPTSALVMDGPYRLTRNPIYLGFLLIYFGFTFLAGTLWGVPVSPFLIATVRLSAIRAEETYLQARFGDQYSAYRSRVRPWI
jgi:protein-S-isoprenylcysteine O-methyltransferase Ste14